MFKNRSIPETSTTTFGDDNDDGGIPSTNSSTCREKQVKQTRMVIIGASPQFLTAQNELRLDSNRVIRYVAPAQLDLNPTIIEMPVVKRKLSDSSPQTDSWDGVAEMCQAMDDIHEIDRDTELLADKSVLELGFCTGLPSIFALDSGATDVTVHSFRSSALEVFVKPTMRRNNVPRNRVKYSAAGLDDSVLSLKGNKFDVILAPELIQADENDFEKLHDLLDAALEDHGIVLLCARSHYSNCTGSMPAFLDLVKQRNVFDAHCRWTSSRSDVAPRRLYQLTRVLR